MTLKEYLEKQIQTYKAFINNTDGFIFLKSDIEVFKNNISMFEGFLKELEEHKKPEETNWIPKVNEYCWFIEDTVEGEFLHFCKIISKNLQVHTSYYGGLEEEMQYRILTSTEEVHQVSLYNLEKFEGTLPSVIREEED